MTRRVAVTVHPGASRAKVEEGAGGLRVWVTARPVEGTANQAVLKAVAKHLGVPSSAVTVVLGMRARRKVLEIAG
ncbi:MAG TPA: DUF167 domain-containing protein [Candidatus Dormibacteraeota bacterium]|nr:DUF167 domain-containing protein [Candidatus Dormibacteraeota bacterium]